MLANYSRVVQKKCVCRGRGLGKRKGTQGERKAGKRGRKQTTGQVGKMLMSAELGNVHANARGSYIKIS